MLRWFSVTRSLTPVASTVSGRNQAGRRSHVLSVTRQPSPAATMSYCHRDTGMPSDRTSNAKRESEASVTVDTVDHSRKPRRFEPRNRAPTAGPAAPPSHRPPENSTATSAIPERELTSENTRAAGAETSTEA